MYTNLPFPGILLFCNKKDFLSYIKSAVEDTMKLKLLVYEMHVTKLTTYRKPRVKECTTSKESALPPPSKGLWIMNPDMLSFFKSFIEGKGKKKDNV